MEFKFAFCLLLAYLFGSLNPAIIFCKLMKLPDPRSEGSHNPGATNMSRHGLITAAIVFFIDASKGAVIILYAKYLGLNEYLQAWIALTAVIGHIYPLYFQFSGGKGVATTLGTLTTIAWPLGMILLLIWFLTVIFTRYSSLGSVIATLSIPFLTIIWLDKSVLFPLFLLCILIIFKHRDDIQRLILHKETKIRVTLKL